VDGQLVPCVGAVMTDAAGRLLLIRRGHEPGRGLWSIPGGRVEAAETDAQALVREVREETGLAVTAGRLLGTVQRPGRAGQPGFDIRDYAAEVTGGVLAAGDDADDAQWVGPARLAGMEARGELTDGLLAALRSWGALPG
jgi:ADP-ribose pyrophosphatase YjhB (NUDIX family)